MFRASLFVLLLVSFGACGTAGVTPEPGIYEGALALQTIASALTCGETTARMPCCEERVTARLAIAHEGEDPRANHRHAIRVGESLAWTETQSGVFFGCGTERYDRWSLLADGTAHLERLVNMNCDEPRQTLVCRYMGSLASEPGDPLTLANP